MQRWDIINKLVSDYNYRNYLEIGYYKGWSFDKIKATDKTAVDPNPCKNTYQESLDYGFTLEFPDSNERIIKMTSDDFFKQNTLDFDIIFIDGLHESNQVFRDIQNSLNVLRPNGTIVLHDCNPPKYEHTTTGIEGCWTGDTYKAILKLQMLNKDGLLSYFTYDTDWGVGILRKARNPIVYLNKLDYQRAIDDWNYFAANREKLLNLRKTYGTDK